MKTLRIRRARNMKTLHYKNGESIKHKMNKVINNHEQQQKYAEVQKN